MFLGPRDNQALNINPPAGDEHLTTGGSDWLWAVTAVFALAFLALALYTAVYKGERIFHYLFTVALLVGSIAYYSMASDLAWNVINQANQPQNGSRQIFFAKYVYWVVSFPVVTIALGLISGVSWATILYNVTLAWIWVLSYLFTAYTATTFKWGFFAFGTVAYLLLAHNTLIESRRSLAARADLFATAGAGVGVSGGGRSPSPLRRDHTALAAWTNLLWLNYPIAFGISDGGNVVGAVAGAVYLGLLDLLLVPVLAAAFLALAPRRWDYGRMNLAFTRYGRVSAAPGTFPEKTRESNSNYNGGVAGGGANEGLVGGPVPAAGAPAV